MLKSGKSSLQFFHYTTSTISNVTSSFSVVDFLVNSLGFSEEEAITTSSKVSSFKSPENPNSVVNFLKTNGFNQPQIKKVVSFFPRILSSNVDKTLKPKLEAFHEFGIHGSEFRNIISVSPRIFSTALNRIVPVLQVLKTIFGDDLSFLQELKRPSWMLTPSIPINAPLNVASLRSYEFSENQIKTLFARKPLYFGRDPEWFYCTLIKVEEKIGIPRDSPMFVRGFFAIGGMREELLELKFGVFRSYGWSELDILTLARKNPHCIALSESKIRTCLDFFMKELGYEPAEIASFSCAFSVSLEKRVIPRNEVLKVLKEKRLIKANYKFFSCLTYTETRFYNKFVLPFQVDVLDVYTDYMRRAGASVKTVEESDKESSA